MNSSIKLDSEPLRTVNHLTIHNAGGIYVQVDAAHTELEHPARMLLVQNFTNADLMFSKDGVNDWFPVAASSYILLDISSNLSLKGGIYCLPQGTRLFVKQIEDPTSGNFYVTTFYGSTGY